MVWTSMAMIISKRLIPDFETVGKQFNKDLYAKLNLTNVLKASINFNSNYNLNPSKLCLRFVLYLIVFKAVFTFFN